MTTDRSPNAPRPRPVPAPDLDDGEEVRALLREAGPRPDPPEEDLALIRAAARQEWKRVVAEAGRRPAWHRAVRLAALAAGLVLAASAVWWLRSRDVRPPVPLATVHQLAGSAWSEGAQSGSSQLRRQRLHASDILVAGAIAGTDESDPGPGKVASLSLGLPGGTSVRLDAGTRVRLASAERLVLQAGAIYVDSGPAHRGPALTVETPLGEVREVGTQFEVRLRAGERGGMQVRVREGAVVVARPEGSRRLVAGRELFVDPDGRVREGPIESGGPAWAWVQAAAPSLDIEGATLDVYLAWVCRETGLRLHYEDSALAGLAPTVVLHGTIAGMAPAESLEAVLPGSGLAYRIEGGTLRITR